MSITFPLSSQLSMYRGQTMKWSVAVTDQANGGVAVNLTGQYLRFIAKRSLQDSDAQAIFAVDTNSNITVTNAAGGLAQIRLDPVHTDALKEPTIQGSARYVWELNMYGNNESWPLNGGTLTIYADVSRNDAP